MALSCGRDGILEDKIMKKGVLLVRRDNSKFIRNIYEMVIGENFNKATKDEVLNLYLMNSINYAVHLLIMILLLQKV